jgi:hypothetical protein
MGLLADDDSRGVSSRSPPPCFTLLTHSLIYSIGYGSVVTISLVALSSSCKVVVMQRTSPLTSRLAVSAVEPKDMAASTGVSYLFRATGSVLGISLSTSILQNSLRVELPKLITGKGSAKIIEKIRTDVGYIKTLPHHLRVAAVEAYQHSMRLVFIAITIAAFLCVRRVAFAPGPLFADPSFFSSCRSFPSASTLSLADWTARSKK